MPHFIPTSGPSRTEIRESARETSIAPIEAPKVPLVDVDEQVVQQLRRQQQKQSFSELFGASQPSVLTLGPGDGLELSIWEAPPAILFGAVAMDGKSNALTTARNVNVSSLMVNEEGSISVPFAGVVSVNGRTLRQVEDELVKRLKGKANQPQVQLRLTRAAHSSVTVVGEVVSSMMMPLTPKGERVLDALATSGGVRHPVGKVSIQMTRGSQVHSLPLQTLIADPGQNVRLMPGDVITALHQPLSFTALGALTKNEEIDFEGQGISLTQALGRLGGLADYRADAQGVFVFRLESPEAMSWLSGVQPGADGKVPVIYRINLKDPRSIFWAQGFPVRDKDVVYVSNAPVADLQKFVNILAGVGYPLLNLYNATR